MPNPVSPLHDSAVALVREALTDPLLKAELISLLAPAMAPAPQQDLLDINQAAKHLAMTTGALRAACYRGSIPYVKVGARLRFKPEDLAHLQQH